MKNLVLLLCAVFLFSGCADNGKEDTVLVFKYKESVHCDFESGIPLVDMMSELTDANIKVLCSSEAHDGNIVVSVCGAKTAIINVYEIPTSALIMADSLGFKHVQLLENKNIVMECGK